MEKLQDHAKAIKAVVTGIAAFTQGLLGWWGILFFFWVGSMCIDWITGTRAAAKNGEWESAKARDGRLHKKGMMNIVFWSMVIDGVAYLIVTYIPFISLPFDYPMIVSASSMIWFILTEAGSAVENYIKLGHPCPPVLAAMLKVMKASIEKAAEKTDQEYNK